MSRSPAIERTFFNLRNTLPGYTFLLIIFLINPNFEKLLNIVNISENISKNISSLFLDF